MSSDPVPLSRGVFERTRDHWWWREGWGPGTRYLTWHLTFEGAGALHETAARVGGRLEHVPGVDVVPLEWLHLTMTGVGMAGDFDPAAVEAIAGAGLDAVGRLSVEPLVFDRAFLYEEGVCLSATARWLQELKAFQADLSERSGGAVSEPGAVFHPHVSLGYFSGEVDEDALRAALVDAELAPVVVPSPRLSLIELGRDDRVYTWRVLAQRTLED